MKHLTKILILLLLISPFQVSAKDLSGQILLQVEQHGEAWYINPTNGNRYYMKDGNTAYEMMRSFGLGITDSDLENIPAVSNVDEMKSADSQCDNDLAKKQSGKILLQVQQHGEAWWVYPDKCLRIYLKNGEEAYIIMRFLGLGITNNDLLQVESDSIEVEEAPQPVVETVTIPPVVKPLEISESEKRKLEAEKARQEFLAMQNGFVESEEEEVEDQTSPAVPEPEYVDFYFNGEAAVITIDQNTRGVVKSGNNYVYYGDIVLWRGMDCHIGNGQERSVVLNFPDGSGRLTIEGDFVVYGHVGIKGITSVKVRGTEFYKC